MQGPNEGLKPPDPNNTTGPAAAWTPHGELLQGGCKAQSWLTGEVPVDAKLRNVTPIYKQGRKEDLVNYRPVSLVGTTEGCGADHAECHRETHTGQAV